MSPISLPISISTMSSISPAILPVSSTPQSSTAAPPPAPVTTPAFRAFINNLSDLLRHGLSQRRPWAELGDRSAFSKPESFSEATLRLRKNYSYFRVNYLALVALILGFSLLSHPFSLLLLAGLLSSWLFLYLFRPSDQPLVLFGRTFKDSETLILLIILSVFVVFLTSVGSVLVSALLLGLGLVCAHGSFRVPEDLFLDEQDNVPTAGFLTSFFTAAASNASAAPIAVRTNNNENNDKKAWLGIMAMFMPTNKHSDASAHDVKSSLLLLSQAATFVADGGGGGGFLGGAAAEVGGSGGG